MRHGSLFTGLEGFGLAAEWMGWTNVFQVENNEWCINQLIKNFPQVKKYADIREFDGTAYAGKIDILTGGFPCQTFSIAGKGAVDLTLWKEMYRIINEIKPPFVVAENVPGIVSRKRGMAFSTVCADLEASGYEVTPINIPVAGQGAPHERERIWFVAHSDRFRRDNEQKENRQTVCDKQRNGTAPKQKRGVKQRRLSESDSNPANTQSTKQERTRNTRTGRNGPANSYSSNGNTTDTGIKRPQGPGKLRRQLHSEQGKERQVNRAFDANQFQESWIEVATRLCGMDDGLPEGLRKNDRTKIYQAVKFFGREETEKLTGIDCSKVNPFRVEELIALGNAVSPIIPYQIFKAIEQTNEKINPGT